MIRIENYKDGDEVGILKLFKKVFKKDLSPDYWDWRFKNNLTQQTLIKLAWHDDKLISHYAACPIPMKYNNENFNAALSMTTMTDPDFNGMGLFPKLANQLYDEMPGNKIEMVYGFPNRNSHYAFIKKLNWENICSIFQFSLTGLNYTKGKYTINTIAEISENHLDNLKLDTNKFQINRNKDFFNWRYKTNPVNEYHFHEIEKDDVKHFIVFKMYENTQIKHIDIVELYINDDIDLLSSFINDIYLRFNLTQDSMFNIWMSLYNNQFTLLERYGFVPKEPITYLGYKSFNFVNNIAEKHTYFTMGDSDVY